MTIKDLTFRVQGDRTIHCSGCERTIQHTLTRLAGVKRVKADYQTQLIELTLDTDTVSPEQVEQELNRIGYAALRIKR